MANSALQGVVANVATPQALQLAYDTRVASMAKKTEYRAAHILVASIEEAEALKAELDAGADFAELASRSSIDTGSGTEGGELGWFGIGTMVAPFEAAVISMNVGAVSGPVQTDFGWHLIKLQETRIQTAPSLEEMTPRIDGRAGTKGGRCIFAYAFKRGKRRERRGRFGSQLIERHNPFAKLTQR